MIRLVAVTSWIAFMCLLVIGVDRVLMHTLLEPQRHFLEDIDHRPNFDGVEFNEDGIRDTRSRSAFRESDFNIVVLGDSFVFGFKLQPSDAIPQQLEIRLRSMFPGRSINVANFGYLSASPYLSLRQLREIGPHYHPDVVLLCLDMTDFHDDIMYEKFDRKPGLFGILKLLPSGFFALKRAARKLDVHEGLFGYPSDRFFVTKRPLGETRGHLGHIRMNINAIDEFTRSALSGSFALVVFPRYFQYNAAECPNNWERDEYDVASPYVHEPFRYLAEIAAEGRYPVGSLLAAFQTNTIFPTVFDDDPHWNRQGVEVAVRALLEFLQQEQLIEPEDSAPPMRSRPSPEMTSPNSSSKNASQTGGCRIGEQAHRRVHRRSRKLPQHAHSTDCLEYPEELAPDYFSRSLAIRSSVWGRSVASVALKTARRSRATRACSFVRARSG